MRKTYTIAERTAVRAYYAYLNGSTVSADADWFAAETKELALAERRVRDATRKTMRAVEAGFGIPATLPGWRSIEAGTSH